MMPSGIAMGILNPVAGKMYDRIGGRPLALLGFAIMTSAAVLLVTIMNTHTAAAMRTGVPEAAASAIGMRASFRTVAIVCAVCLVASLFIRDRGRRLGHLQSSRRRNSETNNKKTKRYEETIFSIIIRGVAVSDIMRFN